MKSIADYIIESQSHKKSRKPQIKCIKLQKAKSLIDYPICMAAQNYDDYLYNEYHLTHPEWLCKDCEFEDSPEQASRVFRNIIYSCDSLKDVAYVLNKSKIGFDNWKLRDYQGDTYNFTAKDGRKHYVLQIIVNIED